MRDLNRRLEMNLPVSEGYTTIAGFLMSEAGQILEPGSTVPSGGHTFTVEHLGNVVAAQPHAERFGEGIIGVDEASHREFGSFAYGRRDVLLPGWRPSSASPPRYRWPSPAAPPTARPSAGSAATTTSGRPGGSTVRGSRQSCSAIHPDDTPWRLESTRWSGPRSKGDSRGRRKPARLSCSRICSSAWVRGRASTRP